MEKGDKLDGNILVGCVPDFKKDDRALLKWYTVQIGKLPVDVKLNCKVELEMIEKSNADVVVFAAESIL